MGPAGQVFIFRRSANVCTPFLFEVGRAEQLSSPDVRFSNDLDFSTNGRIDKAPARSGIRIEFGREIRPGGIDFDTDQTFDRQALSGSRESAVHVIVALGAVCTKGCSDPNELASASSRTAPGP